MSVNVNDLFMAGRPEILEKIKETVNINFNIQESG